MAKIVKPTPSEEVVIDKRLRKMYPQMYEPGWGDAALMKDMAQARARATAKAIKKKKKPLTTTRTKAITNRLEQAGLTEAEIKRLRGNH
jgi:hypothetical protein